MPTPRQTLLTASLLLPTFAHAATVVGDFGVSTTGYVSTSQLITTNISLTTGATTWGYISSTTSYLPNLSTNQISASRVTSLSAPTASTDAATKAYVDSVAAAAGGSSGPICGTTRTRYSGNLGGLAGADAKCAADFGVGWRMATIGNAISGLRAVYNGRIGWVHTASNNCSNWTDGTNAGGGDTLYYPNGSTPYWTNSSSACDSSWPILCCNF